MYGSVLPLADKGEARNTRGKATAERGGPMMNPLSFLLPPILLVLSVPFAAFAIFTTIIALSALTFRALVVYIELAVVVIHNYVFLRPPSKSSRRPRVPSSRDGVHRRKKRRSSGSSAVSDQGPLMQADRDNGGFALTSSVGIERDFEGVGGWSLSGPNEDALWTSMNSRLELPAEERQRRHRRSLTASGIPSGNAESRSRREWRYSSEGIGISPIMSRARTPPAAAFGLSGSPEGYFSFRPMTRMNLPGEAVNKSLSLHHVPPSPSTASSGSSSRTSHLTMKNTS
ncbi:hypothetical protein FGG08_006432 [Glutinoglossum americanum]|uniref:Uncharacterized protein n=1 Tax=Glutinoglossum americanum TaxID=1670608 RepID=A0A9P8I7E2_9PEZI|nr:hypothetical protein FGG08_006432 [Glutinoglossum americanum]